MLNRVNEKLISRSFKVILEKWKTFMTLLLSRMILWDRERGSLNFFPLDFYSFIVRQNKS